MLILNLKVELEVQRLKHLNKSYIFIHSFKNVREEDRQRRGILPETI